MKILVTGGTGFLGRYIVDALRGKVGNDVQVLSRSRLADIQVDLASCNDLILGDFDLVVHCAGAAHTYPSTDEECKAMVEANVSGTLNLIRSLNNTKKLIFISTVAVYGLEEGTLISEDTPESPTSVYGESKLSAERNVLKWGQQNNVDVYVLRLPLILGEGAPGNLGSMDKVIRSGLYFRVYGINPRKGVVYATDVARFIACGISGPSGVYNLASLREHRLSDVEAFLKLHIESKRFIPTLPRFIFNILSRLGDFVSLLPLNSERRKKMEFELTFDSTRAVRLIGWSPKDGDC